MPDPVGRPRLLQHGDEALARLSRRAGAAGVSEFGHDDWRSGNAAPCGMKRAVPDAQRQAATGDNPIDPQRALKNGKTTEPLRLTIEKSCAILYGDCSRGSGHRKRRIAPSREGLSFCLPGPTIPARLNVQAPPHDPSTCWKEEVRMAALLVLCHSYPWERWFFP